VVVNAASRSAAPAPGPLRGRIAVPGDKSIAHRAVLFNAVARGAAEVRGLPGGADVQSTISVCRALGARIDDLGQRRLLVHGTALRPQAPQADLDCGNSGTTMRLVMGVLAGTGVAATLDGDESLRRRPMERVAAPLRRMGARIETTEGRAPVRIAPADLSGCRIRLEVASAQLKSAILLAGLSAAGETVVVEPEATRDHTERMLAAMGVSLRREGLEITMGGPCVPTAVDVDVPGDPSSAAFFAVAASVVPGSDVTIDHVCLNPTRTGFLDILSRMGADVEVASTGRVGGEEVGSIRVRSSELRGVVVEGDEIPRSVDEIPVLCVAAALAEGSTEIRGAAELRVKESDRIAMVAAMLEAFGRSVEQRPDGLRIEGSLTALAGGGRILTGGDHRMSMSAFVAALRADKSVEVDRAESAGVSFPEFFETLEGLSG
jgi:3-phosphoshikimate 1-carboxyvinyltransferase